ncbi:unnamed protein product [Sphagnum balticum]
MPTFLDDRQVVNRAALSAIGSAANTSLDSIFSSINTIFGNATSAATASVIMERDANANTQVNNIIENFATTVTAAGTTTLTVASAHTQQFTGTTTQTVVLPDATTLSLGHSFLIANRSTGFVTVNKNGGTLVQSMAPGSQTIVTVTNIATSAGAWDSAYSVAGSLPFLQTNVITDATTTGSSATLQTGDIVDGVVRLTNASLSSVSGIPAGASGQQIIIENQTGATITIKDNDSGASAANRIRTGTGASVTMATNSSFTFVYDSTVSLWMLIGAVIAATQSVNANYNTSASIAVSNSNAVVPFATKNFDSNNAYNTSTGLYTVQVSGKYRVSAFIRLTSVTSGNQSQLFLYKNGSEYSMLGNVRSSTTAPLGIGGTDTISCNANDTIAVYANSDNSTTTDGTAANNHIAIEMIGN